MTSVAEPTPMPIDYVADVVCPWCYVGWARLQRALELRPGVRAMIRWRPYQLDPDLPEEGTPRKALMAAKFGADPERLAAVHQSLIQQASDAGLDLKPGEIDKSPNSNAAHRLIVWAEQDGCGPAVAEAVMRAYWTDLADIGDPAVLADIGAAHGMDREVIARRFGEGAGKDFIRQACEAATRSGVQGVPFMIFADRVAVSGAHPPEQLALAIDKALELAT